MTLLITGDEELGSTTSRALIEQEAGHCRAVLVLEAAGPEGALKTGRKGVSLYRIDVLGRAAHSGLDPEKGVNATIAIADVTSSIDGSLPPVRVRADMTRPPEPLEGAWECAGHRAEVAPDADGLTLTLWERKEHLRDGTAAEPESVALHASNIPGVYAYTTAELAGEQQFRPVAGGAYNGHRFLRQERS
ncbi:peptidase dimerization domain-containing protein [Nonomuraea sp. NPDC050153]|uniref:peptidase dimerization domain-containing protein n=1 Tax=Nonomuraea sp. NPDC050153 TaxID=3364359 RepID=UPI0037A51437